MSKCYFYALYKYDLFQRNLMYIKEIGYCAYKNKHNHKKEEIGDER